MHSKKSFIGKPQFIPGISGKQGKNNTVFIMLISDKRKFIGLRETFFFLLPDLWETFMIWLYTEDTNQCNGYIQKC